MVYTVLYLFLLNIRFVRHYNLFTHSTVDWYLCSFQFLANMKNTITTILTCVFGECMYVFLLSIPLAMELLNHSVCQSSVL